MNCPHCSESWCGTDETSFSCGCTWHLSCIKQFDIRQSPSYEGRSFFEIHKDKCPKCVRYCDKFTRAGRCPRGDECLFYHPDERARAEIMKGDLMPKQRPPKPVREKIANITEQYKGWYDPKNVQDIIDER